MPFEAFREALKVYTKQSDPMLLGRRLTNRTGFELRGGTLARMSKISSRSSVATTRQTLDGFPRRVA